jgi:hypothetical protein
MCLVPLGAKSVGKSVIRVRIAAIARSAVGRQPNRLRLLFRTIAQQAVVRNAQVVVTTQ